MASIRDQISGLTVAQLTASQLSSVGGKVFMSANAVHDQQTAHDLVTTWRAIHVPTYGQPIPGTAFKITHLGDGALYAPASNESAYITAITVSNADPANPAGVTIDLDGVIIANVASVGSFGFEMLLGIGEHPLMMAEGASLTVSVSGATPALVTTEATGFLVVQG